MVEVHETVAGFRRALAQVRAGGRSVGLVPTMGALHAGHRSLIERAAVEADVTAVTIFVNPLQFAPHEDLSRYPRPFDADLAVVEAAGGSVVLHPSVEEMYPVPIRTTVSVAGVSEGFEGASRPTHFAGVATVVAKLLSIAGPCRAYFGEKDYQQLAVVRRMALDLSLPVEIVGCPIVRADDGLALSSRNVYLTPAQRAAAPALHEGLLAGRAVAEAGEADPAAVVAAVADRIAAEPEAALDYAALVDAETLEPATAVGGGQRLLVAAAFGPTRLLDNLAVITPPR